MSVAWAVSSRPFVAPPEPRPALPPSSPVECYWSQQVRGTSAAGYFGPVASQVYLASDMLGDDNVFERAQVDLLDMLRRQSRARGGNAVVALEVTLDPFHERGLHLHAQGTAAYLVPVG